MLKNHLKLAFRGLLRDHVYSFINIGGLAVGIAASVLLLLWVQDELSFDAFHKKADRLYKVNANFDNNGTKSVFNTLPGPMAVFAKREVPTVEDAVRIGTDTYGFQYTVGDKNFIENKSAYVDPSFLTMFDFPLIQGNISRPFPDNRSLILSETTAKKFFGTRDALGKTLRLHEKDVYTVSGVMEDMPLNSSMRYDILLPFDILIQNYRPSDTWKGLESDWGDYYYTTFVLLHDPAKAAIAEDQLTAIHAKHQAEARVRYTFQPVNQLHLYGPNGKEEGIQTVRIFLIVAVALLVIACINYVNLATARATKRAKEVGVRKTVGADRWRLTTQFLVESSLISTLALALALIGIQVVSPIYSEISGKQLSLNLLDSGNLVLLAAILAATWLASGLYPALVLSAFQPVQVLRSKLSVSGGNSTFRKVLVVTQFALSIAIIAGTFIVNKQISYIRNKDLGYDKENTFRFGLRGEMFGNKATIRNELLKHPGIAEVTMANQDIMQVENTTGDTEWEGRLPDQNMMIHAVSVDSNFIETMGLEIIEGKSFTGARSDTAAFILNEAAIREAGIYDPIGKSFTLWDFQGSIIGVVRDFHHSSVKSKIEPAIFFYRPSWLWIVYVKTNGKDNAGALAIAEKIWKQYNPVHPFDYQFLDVHFDNMYKAEQRTETLLAGFSIVAILISCLGLFGLATFTAAQRSKEVGVRKVMGASVSQIVMLLSKDFMKLVAFALVIAMPLSYYGMQNWLEDFAYHESIGFSIFIWSGVLAFTVALLTISVQTVKTARSNPTNSLRSE
jgi:putative ABC transport system permease protein